MTCADGRIVEVVARSLYESAVRTARGEVVNVGKDEADLSAVFGRCRDQGDLGVAASMLSLFDDLFLAALTCNMPQFDDQVQERLLAPSAPLGAVRSRVLLCYGLGWINADVRRDVDLVAEIRDQFEHEPDDGGGFDRPPVSRSLARMDEREGLVIDALQESSFSVRRALSSRSRFLLRCGLLYGRACAELSVRPPALKNRVQYRDVLGGRLDEHPAGLGNLMRALARAIIPELDPVKTSSASE